MKELEAGCCLFTILWIAIFWDVFDAVSKGDIVSTCALFNGGILNKDMNISLNNLFRSNT